MPKKMRRLALRCLLSAKVAAGELKVLENFGLDEPKTKGMARLLSALGVGASTLLVTAEADATVYKSARNLAKTKVMPAALLNVVDLLSHRFLIVSVEAVHKIEKIWGRKGLAQEMTS
jgi:large subunit ribosomal protein L4